MNVVREISQINARELENLAKTGGAGSWHDTYKDSAYIFAGGLPRELTEGDVITIFSQYGEIVNINMPRGPAQPPKKKDDGQSPSNNEPKDDPPKPQKMVPKGFAFLMYEDQRSTVLAVDNLNGAKVLGRTLRVDHVSKYKELERDSDGKMKERDAESRNAVPELHYKHQSDDSPEDSDTYSDIDIDDPMRDYLIAQRKEEKKTSSKRKRKDKGKKREHETESKEERRERRAEKKRRKEERHRAKGLDKAGNNNNRLIADRSMSRSPSPPPARLDSAERRNRYADDGFSRFLPRERDRGGDDPRSEYRDREHHRQRGRDHRYDRRDDSRDDRRAHERRHDQTPRFR